MKIKLKSIKIENFKGIKSLAIDFSEDITRLSARNGAGKTTICDAISYCLFGKDAKGNTAFGLKPRDEFGNEILHLDHSVTLTLTANEQEFEFKRILREKWTKPRGSEEEVLTGNYIDYYINGEKITKTDYEKKVFSFAGINLFPLLSSPSSFCAQHWQDQRSTLATMAGDITDKDVIGNDARYEKLHEELQGQSIEAYRKHLSYQIRELKKAIDEMPVKIETLKSTLPELPADTDSMREQLEIREREQNEAKAMLARYMSGNGKSLLQSQLEDKISFSERRIDNIRQSKRNLARQEADRLDSIVREAQANLFSAETTQQQLVFKRKSIETIIDKCNEHLDELSTAKAMLESDWNRLSEEKFSFDQEQTICPTCKQELPAEQIQEIYEKAKETFLKTKADRKLMLREKASKVKDDVENTNKEKEDSIDMLNLNQEQIYGANQEVTLAKQKLEEAKQDVAPTAEELLEKDDNYKAILEEIRQYREQMLSDDKQDYAPQIEETNSRLSVLNEAVNMLRQSIAVKEQYDRISKMIDDTRSQWKKLNTQLTELEKCEDLAKSYMEKRDNILETRVNSLFEFTKFKMFKTQVDGTKEPFCTATFHGVEYRDLNTAMKINVGLDIINALSKHYDTYVPISIDNSESVTYIMPTDSQQIQLYVGEQENITIV